VFSHSEINEKWFVTQLCLRMLTVLLCIYCGSSFGELVFALANNQAMNGSNPMATYYPHLMLLLIGDVVFSMMFIVSKRYPWWFVVFPFGQTALVSINVTAAFTTSAHSYEVPLLVCAYLGMTIFAVVYWKAYSRN